MFMPGFDPPWTMNMSRWLRTNVAMNHEHCEAQNVFHTRMGYMKSWEVVQSFQKFFFF